MKIRFPKELILSEVEGRASCGPRPPFDFAQGEHAGRFGGPHD
jgi:hypothetical protein